MGLLQQTLLGLRLFLSQLCGAALDRFADDPASMEKAGIAYATDQIIDLIANGVERIHLYTMNRPAVAAAIFQNLGPILSHVR